MTPGALREHHEVRQARTLSVAQKCFYEVIQEKRCISAGSTLGVSAVCQVQEAEASGCRRQQRPSSRIGCWSSAGQSKPFGGAWDTAKVDQKDLDERRNSWRSLRQSRTELRTDYERDRCRRLRRLKMQGAGTEASISRNGTTALGESRWGPRVDC